MHRDEAAVVDQGLEHALRAGDDERRQAGEQDREMPERRIDKAGVARRSAAPSVLAAGRGRDGHRAGAAPSCPVRSA